jgi:hypothetical protein
MDGVAVLFPVGIKFEMPHKSNGARQRDQQAQSVQAKRQSEADLRYPLPGGDDHLAREQPRGEPEQSHQSSEVGGGSQRGRGHARTTAHQGATFEPQLPRPMPVIASPGVRNAG